MDKDSTAGSVISEVFLSLSDSKHGELTLYAYQKEFINTEKRWLSLETPTGSGKTLALLGRVLLGQLLGDKNPDRNALFIYPTNELINDQIHSLSSLINKLGFQAINLDVEQYLTESSNWRRSILNDLKQKRRGVVVLPLYGAYLDILVEAGNKAKGDLIFGLLTEISSAGIPCIICSNIDTLYLILQGKYRKSARILNTLLNWRKIAIDEFHLYSGIELANLMYSLMLYYLCIKNHPKGDYWIAFSSATPSPVIDIFQNVFPEDTLKVTCKLLSCLPSEKGRRIRHRCNFQAIPRSSMFYGKEDLDFLAEFVIATAREKKIQCINGFNVALLVLVDSVMFAEQLYQEIRKRLAKDGELRNVQIERIHGMIPQRSRVSIDSLESAILIGTRAIEIGIDFDVPILVFEARSRGSFFQRLGRGGRHSECDAYSFVPATTVHQLKRHMKKSSEITFRDFQALVNRDLPREEKFEAFLSSKEAITLLNILIFSLEPDKRGVDYRESWNERKNLYRELKSTFCSANGFDLPDIDEFINSVRPALIRELRKQAFARARSIDFPGLVRLQGLEATWMMISVFDLLRCEFVLKKYIDLDSETREKLPMRWRVHDDELIPLITSFKDSKINCSVLHTERQQEFFPSKKKRVFYTNHRDHELIFRGDLSDAIIEKINRLIGSRKIPFTHVPHSLDWRIPCIPKSNALGFIVIGEAAYLAAFLLN